MKQVYLDYAATTPVKEEVRKEMLPFLTERFGNPSSGHRFGQAAKDAVKTARKRVAACVGAEESEIYFTSGGTEADNWAVLGAVDEKRGGGGHIITTKIEHPAMLRACGFLEQRGSKVTYLDVGSDGRASPGALESAITDQTILISAMLANNEIGVIQPVRELSRIAQKRGILFHTDAVQALGNIPIDVKDLGADLMSLSAHKIYGPKGVGALYIRKGVKLSNLIHGGEQEGDKRAGTENVPGIVGFGKAAELAEADLGAHIQKTKGLRDYFIDQVMAAIPGVTVNGSLEHRHPGNASLTFDYIEGEALLDLLNAKGIAASTGSACTSSSQAPSHVLLALNMPLERIHGTLRFTFGAFTTKEELDYTVAALSDTVKKLREISPFSAKKGW